MTVEDHIIFASETEAFISFINSQFIGCELLADKIPIGKECKSYSESKTALIGAIRDGTILWYVVSLF